MVRQFHARLEIECRSAVWILFQAIVCCLLCLLHHAAVMIILGNIHEVFRVNEIIYTRVQGLLIFIEQSLKLGCTYVFDKISL